MEMKSTHIILTFAFMTGGLISCQGKISDPWNGSDTSSQADKIWTRSYEVLLTDPHCDVCNQQDKDFLLAHSPIIPKVIQLIQEAKQKIDIAQFTFSRKEIEQALIAAHQRGVKIRLALDWGQKKGDNPANRLKDAGLDVRFIRGKPVNDYYGLMHAKFMLVDNQKVLHGSNNWSSTGTSFNNENTVLIHSSPEDPLVMSFDCAFETIWKSFETIWEQNPPDMRACSTDEVVFTPSSAPIKMLKNHIRHAQRSIDVMMHHFLFGDLVKELAKAAENGVRVRVVVNVVDQEEASGKHWARLFAAGGQIRFKQTNPDLYQIMHNKLAIIDNTILLNGSGNWSGSAFFNNFEFYIVNNIPLVVKPFREMFRQVWSWSLSAESLEQGLSAAKQEVSVTKVFFGNLHAHYTHIHDRKILDDGKLIRRDDQGQDISVESEVRRGEEARYAFEYARDVGQMDFLALTPHVVDDRESDSWTLPSMSIEGYEKLKQTATDVTVESQGSFLALAGMEWNTNGEGNRMCNVFVLWCRSGSFSPGGSFG